MRKTVVSEHADYLSIILRFLDISTFSAVKVVNNIAEKNFTILTEIFKDYKFTVRFFLWVWQVNGRARQSYGRDAKIA